MSKRTKIWMAICIGLPVINFIPLCLRWVVWQVDRKSIEMLAIDDKSQALRAMSEIMFGDLYYLAAYSLVTWIIAIVTVRLVIKDNSMPK